MKSLFSFWIISICLGAATVDLIGQEDRRQKQKTPGEEKAKAEADLLDAHRELARLKEVIERLKVRNSELREGMARADDHEDTREAARTFIFENFEALEQENGELRERLASAEAIIARLSGSSMPGRSDTGGAVEIPDFDPPSEGIPMPKTEADRMAQIPMTIPAPILIPSPPADDSSETPEEMPPAAKDELPDTEEEAPSPQDAEGTRVQLTRVVDFEPGSAVNRVARDEILQWIESIVAVAPDLKLRVIGYAADAAGPIANQSLASNRAQFLADYLVIRGVEEARFESVSAASENTDARSGVEIVAFFSAPQGP
ncbi:MAG: OmpA family protein [Verrucomicrobiota bacterium]